MSLSAEDLTEIEQAGRRCAVCGTGRRWRDFEVLRPEGSAAIVMCAGCKARFGEAPPVKGAPEPAAEPAAVAPEPTAPTSTTAEPTEPSKDRLRVALQGMTGTFSTGAAARAAGLNSEKTLARLIELERRGHIQRIGNRWSSEPPPTDITAAMDRLEARTSNLRIVRDRAKVS